MDGPKVIRPCGPRENISTARHALGLCRCVATTCRYELPSGLSRDVATLKAALYPALAKVVLGQPFLQVGIIDEGKTTPCFVYVPAINLDLHVEFKEIDAPTPEDFDSQLMTRVSWQHDQLWPDVGVRQPWKLIVYTRATNDREASSIEICHAFHHAISDGTGSKIFHIKLLEALNQPTPIEELKGSVLRLDKVPALPEPQEIIVPFTLSWWYFLGVFWNELAPKWLQRQPAVEPWTSNLVDLTIPFKTRNIVITVPAAAVGKLLKRCRANETTLTPLFNVLILASLSRRLSAATAPCFAFSTPISLRPYVPPEKNFAVNDTMHNLVTAYETKAGEEICERIRRADAATSEQFLWDEARAMKTDLKRKTDQLPTDDNSAMIKYAGDLTDWWRARHGKPRPASWELSNVGTMDGGAGRGDGWRASRLVFSQGAHVASVPFCVNMAGILGGDLALDFSWGEGLVENELVEGAAADTSRWVRNFAEHGAFGIFASG